MVQKQAIVIHYHQGFAKRAQKYFTKRKAIEKAIAIFGKNPADSRIKTHKLKGELSGYWSFSVDYHLRILFRFIDKKTVPFLDIGTHEIYR